MDIIIIVNLIRPNEIVVIVVEIYLSIVPILGRKEVFRVIHTVEILQGVGLVGLVIERKLGGMFDVIGYQLSSNG